MVSKRRQGRRSYRTLRVSIGRFTIHATHLSQYGVVTVKQHIDEKLIPILAKVSDPEIPVLSIMDMGVVRSAVIDKDQVRVQITPTYSGCPAMDVG